MAVAHDLEISDIAYTKFRAKLLLWQRAASVRGEAAEQLGFLAEAQQRHCPLSCGENCRFWPWRRRAAGRQQSSWEAGERSPVVVAPRRWAFGGIPQAAARAEERPPVRHLIVHGWSWP